MKDNTSTYLDSYTLQSDSRIRLPKAVLTNLNATPGATRFDIWFDAESKEVILKVSNGRSKRSDPAEEKQ